MKKHILALAVAISSMFCASAADDYAYSLCVNQKDGEKVEFKFEDQPIATIENDNLKITLYETDDLESVLFPIDALENITFTRSNLTGVNAIDSKGKVSFGLTREALDVNGLASGVNVDIFASDGRHVAHAACGADGSARLDLSPLGKGVYTVKAGKQTFKFIR